MNDAQRGKLDQVRAGAETLVALTEGRILEAQAALVDGKFGTAMTRLQEAQAKLSPLVHAVSHMAFEEGTSIIRAKHLHEDMVLTGLGRIEDLDITTDDHGHEDPCITVVAKIEGQERPQQFGGDQEVLIRV